MELANVNLDRFQPPRAGEGEAKIIGECACGCRLEIIEGYDHVDYDGEWFYDDGCLLKYLGAEWRTAG